MVRHIRDRRSWKFWTFGAVIAVMLCLVGACAAILIATSAPTSERLDLSGNRVELDPGTAPSSAVAARMKVTEDTGQRFAVPSVGLNVPLGSLNEVDNTITPPGFTSAYMVRNMGTGIDSPEKGTMYVVTHSLRGGGRAPGNYLADSRTQSSAVKSGAVITVGKLTYRVTTSQTVSKKALPATATVWTNTANRLVVITCLEPADGSPSTDNLIIFATLQP